MILRFCSRPLDHTCLITSNNIYCCITHCYSYIVHRNHIHDFLKNSRHSEAFTRNVFLYLVLKNCFLCTDDSYCVVIHLIGVALANRIERVNKYIVQFQSSYGYSDSNKRLNRHDNSKVTKALIHQPTLNGHIIRGTPSSTSGYKSRGNPTNSDSSLPEMVSSPPTGNVSKIV